jgi:hypothetical protein
MPNQIIKHKKHSELGIGLNILDFDICKLVAGNRVSNKQAKS